MKKRLNLLSDSDRERLIGIAGTKGQQMAEKGSEALSKGIASAGEGIGKAIKGPDVKTVKTVEAPAEEMEKLPEMKSPYDMQEPEAPGLDDSFREERKRRMRARMFTA